jgi:tetratricopeptide (TPR) repeat protein
VLLDRQRVKFWQKWVFGFMALIMAGFLVMIPLSNNMGCGGSGTASVTEQLNKDIAKYQAAVKADPKNVEAWRSLAENYALRANAQPVGSAAEQADLRAAAQYYERAAKILSKQKGAAAKQLRLDTLQQLVSVFMSLKDNQAATSVYGQITALTPNNAQAFAEMATVAMNAGDTNTALLAWTKYLKLDPNAPDAQAIQDWIDANSGSPSPTPSPSSSAGGGQ